MSDMLLDSWEEAAEAAILPAPPDAVELLRKAAGAYLETEVALVYLKEADRLYGNFIPVVVGCYKFHFYKGMLREAIPYALKAARIMGDHLGLPASFEQVRPDDAAFAEYEQQPRFYMFAMKAAGYLHARLGETEQALAILRKVRELDSQDRMGVTRLIGVIENGGREEEE
ncbi:MAG: hypothetical protein ACYCXP_06180 [Leptospirillum sp.]